MFPFFKPKVKAKVSESMPLPFIPDEKAAPIVPSEADEKAAAEGDIRPIVATLEKILEKMQVTSANARLEQFLYHAELYDQIAQTQMNTEQGEYAARISKALYGYIIDNLVNTTVEQGHLAFALDFKRRKPAEMATFLRLLANKIETVRPVKTDTPTPTP